MGVSSLPKTVTRQRRGCDLNPGPSAPESSTLTTQMCLELQKLVCYCHLNIKETVHMQLLVALFSNKHQLSQMDPRDGLSHLHRAVHRCERSVR